MDDVMDKQLIPLIWINILQTGSLELKPGLIKVSAYELSELNPRKRFNQ